ncbi:hypothetical protein [Streptomyces galbus]|uniref:Uncharacterized protein n=1 Tax=Streptomyces galbus TaxID=33898 RepID=A0ABX1ID40_STRGB|nr:hypothetical protein [Streptomyces galbus]NKQ23115.1 hypothetical protein [Streptomyces galbus]
MLPTGYATDFVADSSLFHAMFRFVRRAQQRWPGLHVDGEPLPPDALGDWHLPEPGEDGRPSAVTFSSGPPTQDRRGTGGHGPDAAGQGPYAVCYRARPQPLGEVLYAVSVVTPADPDTDPFSRDVVRDFLEAFEGGRPGSVRHA